MAEALGQPKPKTAADQIGYFGKRVAVALELAIISSSSISEPVTKQYRS